MSRSVTRTSRVLLAVFGLLLVGGAVTFAQHNAVVRRMLTSPVQAVASTEGSAAVQQVANRPLVKLFLTGAILRDKKMIPVEKAGPVTPGEVVSFTMSSVNEGSAPARNYSAVGQIPRSAVLVAGSALSDGTRVTYSIDNGEKFSLLPMIDEKQADGTIKKVAAPIWMYTQLRFEWADPLAVGGKLVASYQVKVK